MIGETIGDGRYRILEVLGQGGMGAVYAAEHTSTGRGVAVKVILRAALSHNPEMVLRFEREARAAGSIDTQHIVQVLDAGTDSSSKTPYLVMELLKGEDLDSLLTRLGPLPPELALRLVAQASIGLQRAHEAGVVHRDIKPANLFLSRREDGEIIVKVVDFGVAKIKTDVTGSRETNLTRTGSMLGSPRYMSPEQAVGKKTIDHRTDVWSLGVVLYELLAGDVPHAHAETLGALIMAICSEPARPIQEVAPWISPDVARLVHRTLSIPEGARLETMEVLLNQIRALVPGGDISVRGDMLVGLSPGERARVAPAQSLSPALDVTAATPGPVESRRSIGNAATLPGSFIDDPIEPVPSMTTPAIRDEPLGATSDPIPSTPAPAPLVAEDTTTPKGISAPPSRRSARRLTVAPVVAGACALGALVYALGGAGGRPRDAAAVIALAPSPPTRPEGRTVRLAVEPADARVELDGREAPVTDGAVEITGAIGGTHRVRLRLGERETTSDVAIAESGAVPSRLTLVAPSAATSASAAPSSAAPSTTARAASPAVGPKPPNNGMTRKFE